MQLCDPTEIRTELQNRGGFVHLRCIFWFRLLFCSSILANGPALVIMYTLTCLIGLVVFAYYDLKGCDPLRQDVGDPNQVESVTITACSEFFSL